MKKFPVLILVFVLALTQLIPVAAKGNGPGGNGPNNPEEPNGVVNGVQTVFSQMQQGPRQTFAMVGTISAIDPDLMTLTILVINGNKLAQGSIGELVPVFVVDGTRYLLKSGTTVAAITFENLAVGQQVSLNGIVSIENDVETWTAYRVTVGAYLTQTHKR